MIVHAAGFNLGLLMHQVTGIGKPRSLQRRKGLRLALILWFWSLMQSLRGLVPAVVGPVDARAGVREENPLRRKLADAITVIGRSSTG